MIFSQEQSKIFEFDKKRMVVSASAGAGKTTTMIEYITRLVEKGEPVKRMLVLTFTKAAAAEMKDRLSERLLARADNTFVQDQIDELMTSDISTIHAFLEKLIRRNISNLPELESFVILDEKEAEKLMAEAFVEALSRFKKQQPEAFENLFFIMRDLGEVKKIVFALHNFLSAQAGRKQLLESFEKNFKTNFLRARDLLEEIVKKEAKEIFKQASQFGCENEKAAGYLDQICSVFQKLQDFDFAKLNETENLSLPRQPILKDYDRLGEIVELKEKANKLLKLLARYAEIPQEAWSGEQTEVLTKQVYALFKEFDRCFRERKVHQNALDFNDLEWQSELIISNPVLLEEVQDKFDYVFVDEYQDTNPVQEKLVKAIAEKGKFVAVGDPKQGIYGFRNATAKIILSDSENFANDKDGSTFYLTENYRSDKAILDFVNSIFSKVMTPEQVGIDYKKTSFLKGKSKVPATNLPAVEIDIAKKQKLEKRLWPEGYHIFDDPLVSEESATLEAEIVAMKVEEFLMSEFVDSQTGEKRKVLPSDIAILSRSRSEVADAVMNKLRERQIPFVSTLRSNLTEKSYIKLLLSLLSLCVNKRDDVALAAYLLSPFAKINPDVLAQLMRGCKEKFWQVVFESSDENLQRALNQLENFKNECAFYGAKKALERLFAEREFYAYLYSEVGTSAVKDVDAFLFVIASYENDRDLPELLAYLSSGVAISSSSSSDAVTISSIHGSKGLEYPIVILIGTGKPMLVPDTSTFKINAELGLALCYYDLENFQRYPSPLLLAERELSKASERIDELMILYVALTRAKSHLVITGKLDSEKVKEYDGELKNFNSFLSLILSACEGAKVCEIESVLPAQIQKVEKPAHKPDPKIEKELEKYLDFVYPFEQDTLTKQKSSVTELSSAGKEFAAASTSFSETGTAYHEALKVLDFDKVEKASDIENQLNFKKFDENMKKLIDFNLIFENICLIKPLVLNKKIFKEKQFVLRLENNQLVQGVVDLFAMGDENILIDYKFTRENDENILKNRYKMQLLLYKQAIEKAENIKIDKVYLISLLNKKIIIF